MNDLTSSGSPSRFLEAHAILTLAEAIPAPGLPFPQIGPSGAGFYFTQILHPEDAAEMVSHAEVILSAGLGVTFEEPVIYEIGSTRRYALEARLPSGMRVSVVARGEHAESIEEARAALKAVPEPAKAAEKARVAA